nr:hypothetical protein [Allochromatium tepidum]
MLDVLVNAHQQILVTTHSQMILNYPDDSVARAGVQYLYKTPEGFTRAVPHSSTIRNEPSTDLEYRMHDRCPGITQTSPPNERHPLHAQHDFRPQSSRPPARRQSALFTKPHQPRPDDDLSAPR